jgi:hypothetical protein
MGLDSEQRLGRKGFGQVGVCPNQSPFEAIKHPPSRRETTINTVCATEHFLE